MIPNIKPIIIDELSIYISTPWNNPYIQDYNRFVLLCTNITFQTKDGLWIINAVHQNLIAKSLVYATFFWFHWMSTESVVRFFTVLLIKLRWAWLILMLESLKFNVSCSINWSENSSICSYFYCSIGYCVSKFMGQIRIC